MSFYNQGWGRKKDPSLFPTIDNTIKINWELFQHLLSFQTPSESYEQAEFAVWMIEVLEEYGAIVHQDEYGNVYAVKGEADVYPCTVAHMDINQNITRDMQIIKTDKWMIAYDNETGTQVGPGFDDKVGVYFCLEMVRQLPAVKIALFIDEEIGCVGSNSCDMSFFNDVSLVFQLDRNSYAGPEFIWYTNSIECCSSAFINSAEKTFFKYGYLPSKGSYTDIGTLKNRGLPVICANIGCGYFDEHSDQEVLYVPAFENAVNFTYELMRDYGDTEWEHVPVMESLPKSESIKTGITTLRYEPRALKLEDNEGYYLWRNNNEYYTKTSDVDAQCVIESIESGYCPVCYSEKPNLEINHHGEATCAICDSYFDTAAAYDHLEEQEDIHVRRMKEKLVESDFIM